MASSSKNTIALCMLINLVLFAANASASATCLLLSAQLSVLSSCALPTGTSTCCGCFNGLTDLQAAACLCAAISANVLGITADATVFITATLGKCNRTLPSGYTCSA